MTFREKFYTDTQNRRVCGCPENYGYEKHFDCSGLNCAECWDREMPGTKKKEETKACTEGETKMEVTTRKTKKELLEEIKELEKALERNERYAQYDEAASETKVLMDSYINVGFSREEAFTIVMKMIVGAINTNRR